MPFELPPVMQAYPVSANEIVSKAWVYMNMARNTLSVLDVSKVPEDYPVMNTNHPDSTMVGFALQVFLENALFVVNVGEREYGIAYARRRAEEGDEPRSPFTRHAVVAGIPILAQNIPEGVKWRAVGYNPFRNDTFVDKETGEPVLSARYVKVSADPATKKQTIYIPV